MYIHIYTSSPTPSIRSVRLSPRVQEIGAPPADPALWLPGMQRTDFGGPADETCRDAPAAFLGWPGATPPPIFIPTGGSSLFVSPCASPSTASSSAAPSALPSPKREGGFHGLTAPPAASLRRRNLGISTNNNSLSASMPHLPTLLKHAESTPALPRDERIPEGRGTQIPEGRLPIPGGRLPVPGGRLQIPGGRLPERIPEGLRPSPVVAATLSPKITKRKAAVRCRLN